MFQYLHTWFGHPRVCWLQVSSAPQRFWEGPVPGRGRIGRSFLRTGKPEGLLAIRLAPSVPEHEFQVYGHLPPAESLRARSAMPLQVATAGFKGPDAGSRAGGRWFLQQRGVVHLSLFSLAKL